MFGKKNGDVQLFVLCSTVGKLWGDVYQTVEMFLAIILVPRGEDQEAGCNWRRPCDGDPQISSIAG